MDENGVAVHRRRSSERSEGEGGGGILRDSLKNGSSFHESLNGSYVGVQFANGVSVGSDLEGSIHEDQQKVVLAQQQSLLLQQQQAVVLQQQQALMMQQQQSVILQQQQALLLQQQQQVTRVTCLN